MKKIIILIALLLTFTSSSKNVLAATPTPEPKAQQQIDDLKTKIASRVAELKLVEKRGVIGVVTDSSDTKITLTDLNGDTKYIDVDELTKFNSPSSKSFGISDIKKDSVLGVIGLYNKQSRRILARTINETTLPKFFYGTTTSIDSKDFSFELLTEKEKIIIDVEDITKTTTYSKESDEVSSAGFSKIKNMDNAYVVGYWDSQKKDHLLASKIILFPDFPNNPKAIAAPNALKGDNIVPSTGSGKKLTPIVK
ncbi:hypothetical protein M1349_01040 [Patescibacteria group bacterium]|nr:hypothetical protein [Patescibacteria group bacterium]